MSFMIMGTTFSGHPTATTLFNTIRVLSYISFACFKAGIHGVFEGANPTIQVFVSGDDITINSNDKYLLEYLIPFLK